MSFRSEFTFKVAELIFWIDAQDWKPILDFAKRTEYEQAHLFQLGLSKCDGIHKISPHQYEASPGLLGVDIYIDAGSGIFDTEIYRKAHEHWIKLGGDEMIEWDQAHFQMRKKE